MTRMIGWTVMALAAGMMVTSAGTVWAGPVGQTPVQVAEASEPAVAASHTHMTTIQSGGIGQAVHTDAATGRLKLCSPTGKREFLR